MPAVLYERINSLGMICGAGLVRRVTLLESVGIEKAEKGEPGGICGREE
jgi:hypothetical protein